MNKSSWICPLWDYCYDAREIVYHCPMICAKTEYNDCPIYKKCKDSRDQLKCIIKALKSGEI